MKNYGLVFFGLGLSLLTMAKLEILSIFSSMIYVVFGVDLGLNFRNSFALDVLLTMISMIFILAGSIMINNEYK